METNKLLAVDSLSDSEIFLERLLPVSRQGRPWPWIVSSGLLSILSIALFFRPAAEQSCIADTKTSSDSCIEPCKQQVWRRSDFPAAREVIELQDVGFTGNSAYDENGRFFVNNPSPVDYISATPEVDEAWNNLTLSNTRDFLISEEEASQLWPNDFKKHWDHAHQGYTIGLDVFHTLHCIDNLRKYTNQDVYPIIDGHHAFAKQHIGHCIDQLRQSVMCGGDMTPYGTRYFPNPGINYADSDVTHSCRNFEKLQDWVKNRYHAGGNVHIPGVEIWGSFENGV